MNIKMLFLLFILISIILISCECYKFTTKSLFLKKSSSLFRFLYNDANKESTKSSLFKLNDANKEYQKEQQFRIQQEMLARRRNKKDMDKYFESVEKKRKEVDIKVKETIYTKITDKEDPLKKWKQNKQEGKIKKLGYEDVPQSKFLTFQLPQNPIGLENMDNGERFDLRLPYSERGYEDEEADLGYKISKFMGNLFGKKNEKK